MAKLEMLRDALVHELKDLYNAENQLLKALPRMAKKASSEKLRELFEAHVAETERQIERLDKISSILGEKLSGKTCKAMKGLIEEGKELLEEESENEAILDCLLIGAARRVEHYEIAAYESACAIAEELENEEVQQLLDETYNEETATDEKLSTLAEEELLAEANSGGEEEEEGEESEEEEEEEEESERPSAR